MSESRLTYNGRPIRERGEMLSLTDMWRAAGGEDSKRPSDWLALPATVEFVSHISDMDNAEITAINHNELRRNCGTLEHWQRGMSKAKYHSQEFHAWCNQVVRAIDDAGIPIAVVRAVGVVGFVVFWGDGAG